MSIRDILFAAACACLAASPAGTGSGPPPDDAPRTPVLTLVWPAGD